MEKQLLCFFSKGKRKSCLWITRNLFTVVHRLFTFPVAFFLAREKRSTSAPGRRNTGKTFQTKKTSPVKGRPCFDRLHPKMREEQDYSFILKALVCAVSTFPRSFW